MKNKQLLDIRENARFKKNKMIKIKKYLTKFF